MIWSFFLSGVIPSKKNSKRIVTRGTRSPILLSSEDYLAWEKRAKYEILGQNRPKSPIKKCHIEYRIIYPDKRVRDISNTIEGINDLFVDMAILVDDKWTVVEGIQARAELAKNKEDTGVWITLIEI